MWHALSFWPVHYWVFCFVETGLRQSWTWIKNSSFIFLFELLKCQESLQTFKKSLVNLIFFNCFCSALYLFSTTIIQLLSCCNWIVTVVNVDNQTFLYFFIQINLISLIFEENWKKMWFIENLCSFFCGKLYLFGRFI